jgi:hypothetical protein
LISGRSGKCEFWLSVFSANLDLRLRTGLKFIVFCLRLKLIGNWEVFLISLSLGVFYYYILRYLFYLRQYFCDFTIQCIFYRQSFENFIWFYCLWLIYTISSFCQFDWTFNKRQDYGIGSTLMLFLLFPKIFLSYG